MFNELNDLMLLLSKKSSLTESDMTQGLKNDSTEK